jgi:hypothetical protein
MRGEFDSFRFCRPEMRSISGRSAKPAAAAPDEKPVFHLLEKATFAGGFCFYSRIAQLLLATLPERRQRVQTLIF